MYEYLTDKRSNKIILPRTYVLDDGMGDIVALCRMVQALKKQIAIINQENSSLYKYSIVPVLCCTEAYRQKVISFLKSEGIITDESEIGKTVHIITEKSGISTMHKDGPEKMVEAHKKYMQDSTDYQEQLKNTAIIIDVPTNIDDRYYKEHMEPNEIKWWAQNSLSHQVQSMALNPNLVYFKIDEPDGHNLAQRFVYSNIEHKLSIEEKKKLLGILSCHFGFGEDEHGLLFDKIGKASKENKQNILIELSKNSSWVKTLLGGTEVNLSTTEKFLAESFIVTSYLPLSDNPFLTFTQTLAQAPISAGKNLVTLSNLPLDPVEKGLLNSEYFNIHNIELIDAKSGQTKIIKPKNTNADTRTIKIVCGISLPSQQHTELMRLADMLEVTGDDSMRKAIDIGTFFLNFLRTHKTDGFKEFIYIIENLKIENSKNIVEVFYKLVSLSKNFKGYSKDEKNQFSKEMAEILTKDIIATWDIIVDKIQKNFDYTPQVDNVLRRTTLLYELPERIQKNKEQAAQDLKKYFLPDSDKAIKILQELRRYYSYSEKDKFKFVLDFLMDITREVVLKEISKWGWWPQYDDEAIKRDAKIVETYIKTVRKYPDDNWKKQKESVLDAIEINVWVFQCIDESLKEDKEIVLKVLQRNPEIISLVPSKIQTDPDIKLFMKMRTCFKPLIIETNRMDFFSYSTIPKNIKNLRSLLNNPFVTTDIKQIQKISELLHDGEVREFLQKSGVLSQDIETLLKDLKTHSDWLCLPKPPCNIL